jgi:hypothetical protein
VQQLKVTQTLYFSLNTLVFDVAYKVHKPICISVYRVNHDFVKICDKSLFVVGTLYWTLSIVRGIFDTHDVSEVSIMTTIS